MKSSLEEASILFAWLVFKVLHRLGVEGENLSIATFMIHLLQMLKLVFYSGCRTLPINEESSRHSSVAFRTAETHGISILFFVE